MEGQEITDEQAAQLQRSRGTNPLFRGLPTGTYSYRYRDAGTSTVDSLNDPPSTDPSDLIAYRETVAVENGAMTLLSKQVGVESPMTGAKGRAREREMRRRGGRRVIMPSQGLVDAARRASFPLIEEHDYSRSSGNLSYPELDANGHPVGRGARRPDEVFLVGCGPGSEGRRTEAKGEEAQEQSSPSAVDHGFVLDGKWMRGAAGVTALAAAPSSETSSHGRDGGWEREQQRGGHTELPASTPLTPTEYLEVSGQQPQQREPLLEENARLKDEIAQLRKEKAQREENARLRDEISKLRLEKLAALEGDRSRSRSTSPDLWKIGAIGGQPRRTANRNNTVGASLRSQEILVEGHAGGKGRAREREEKLRLNDLTRHLADSEDDDRKPGLGVQEDVSDCDEEYRGRMQVQDEAAAALANLPEDIRRKYAPDRPSRIWRDHSHEILVESDVTGARGRRREVNLKRDEPARFMPSQEMRDAAAAMEAGAIRSGNR